MNLYRLRIGVLGTVVALAPSLLCAQMGSTMPNNQPTQPNQPPSAQPGEGTGMAGAMTAGSGMGANDVAAQNMKDRVFVEKAAEGGLAEVQLGQLAAQKASGDDVKQFAQKMVDDHTMLNESMKPIADQMGVREPTKLNRKDQAEYDKLNGLSGGDFDKEYLMAMVKDHHEDLRDFRMESMMAANSDLKTAVDKGTAVIQQHMQMVDKLAKDKGIEMPGRHGGHAGPAQ